MRVEGLDAGGRSGYWEKDLAETRSGDWRFVVTDEPLQGRALPLPGSHRGLAEDFRYDGRIDLDGTTLELELHSTDGMRQERRARGLDLYPRYYRAAVKVPATLWQQRAQQPTSVQDFLARHFGDRPVLETELYATLGRLQIAQPCWTLSRDAGGLLDALTQPPLPDAGTLLAILLAQQEDGRVPAVCLPNLGS
jgi:hypothetical protein